MIGASKKVSALFNKVKTSVKNFKVKTFFFYVHFFFITIFRPLIYMFSEKPLVVSLNVTDTKQVNYKFYGSKSR